MITVLRNVASSHGIQGLFAGLLPRACLSVYQTLFMVTAAKIIKDSLS